MKKVRPIDKKKLKKPKAVIFDLDGVLINSIPFYVEAWKVAFSRFNIKIHEFEIYEREGEKSIKIVRDIYWKFKLQDPSEETANNIIRIKDSIFKKIYRVELFPGSKELIKELNNRGVKLGLVTGSRDPEEKLGNSDLLELFDVIITGKDVNNSKPHPEPYLKALEKLNIPRDYCYVIENAPNGIKSAISAGLICFAIRSCPIFSIEHLEKSGALYVYDRLDDLGKQLFCDLGKD
jgi:beta-phosphoglucomutase